MVPGTARRARNHVPTLLLALAVCACGRAPDRAPEATPNPAGSLAGRVTIDGSSTMLPLVNALAERFQQANPAVTVSSTASTTAAGLKELCDGQLDVAAASRPINAAEIAACRGRRVEFIELPVAFDSLTVVVNAKNTFVDCLTVAELKRMWEPAAGARINRWRDIRRTFPPDGLTLFGPGRSSGTFDYFTLAIVGEQGGSRSDYNHSDDNAVLADGVARDEGALGYFGYAFYQANRHRLKVVAIDAGQGCVVPSAATVMEESYRPLTRPVFLYVASAALTRTEVAAFARYAVWSENAGVVEASGYIPLPAVASLIAGKHLAARSTGSIFGGRGAVLGVTARTFVDEDRLKSALVR
jgi:phosphate transport system substrate-binding protein